MNVRLIKPSTSPPEETAKRPAEKVPVIDTIRSWVREFQTTRADRARQDFERVSNLRKT